VNFNLCPGCKNPFEEHEQKLFSNIRGIRQVVKCPNCSANLIWAKWPYWFWFIGRLTGLSGLWVYFLLRGNLTGTGSLVFGWCFIVILFLCFTFGGRQVAVANSE